MKGDIRKLTTRKIEDLATDIDNVIDDIELTVKEARDTLRDARVYSNLEDALEAIETAYQTLDDLADKLY